jgi:glycosyltransferase involved in cell wall biosynthesis
MGPPYGDDHGIPRAEGAIGSMPGRLKSHLAPTDRGRCLYSALRCPHSVALNEIPTGPASRGDASDPPRSSMPSVLILVENNSAPADSRVWAICKSLRRAGWDVCVISPTGHARDTERFATREGVRFYRFKSAASSGSGLGYLREYTLALTRMWSLVRKLSQRQRFDVVHACNPPDVLLLTALGLRRQGTATIFDHHDLSPELYCAKYGGHPLIVRMLKLAERLGFSLSDVCLASNESFREIALGRGRKSADDVFVVRNGPDTDVFRPREGDPELRDGVAHVIGYVGLIGTQDGAEVALESLGLLRDRRNDWRAVFVGDGDALPSVKQRASELGLDDVVAFLGYIRDPVRLVEIISTCDVCLSPEPRNSLNERSTFVKVAEYMAVGRPVIAFDLPETHRTADGAACYAKGDDAASFADAIERVLDDPELRESMGVEGRRRVEEELGWEPSEKALLAAYDRALAVATTRG